MKVGIVGIGNCASSFVQAVSLAGQKSSDELLGLRNPSVAGLRVEDIEIVAAFDVAAVKVGRDLSEAIYVEPNVTTRYVDVPEMGVVVERGPLQDGLSDDLRNAVPVSERGQVDVEKILEDCAVDVVVSFLPVGSRRDSEAYARAACRAGCAYVNCNPDPIVHNEALVAEFVAANLPLLGDDIKSQIGATALHRAILEFLRGNGVLNGSSYQLNYGGNFDFRNMQDQVRAGGKRRSKLYALSDLVNGSGAVVAGPAGYVPFLGDTKIAHMQFDGHGFLGMDYSIDVKLKVEDSPNAAGVAVDAVRIAAAARGRSMGGPVDGPCALLFKRPPAVMSDVVALESFLRFADSDHG